MIVSSIACIDLSHGCKIKVLGPKLDIDGTNSAVLPASASSQSRGQAPGRRSCWAGSFGSLEWEEGGGFSAGGWLAGREVRERQDNGQGQVRKRKDGLLSNGLTQQHGVSASRAASTGRRGLRLAASRLRGSHPEKVLADNDAGAGASGTASSARSLSSRRISC